MEKHLCLNTAEHLPGKRRDSAAISMLRPVCHQLPSTGLSLWFNPDVSISEPVPCLTAWPCSGQHGLAWIAPLGK